MPPLVAAAVLVGIGLALAGSVWVDVAMVSVRALPEGVRERALDWLDESDAGRRVLSAMLHASEACPACGKTASVLELNEGMQRRCGACAIWGRYPGMPDDKRAEIDEVERAYTVSITSKFDAAASGDHADG